ncbi:MAG: aspartate aminotransferase family protein, partial [bacterium]
APQGPVYQAGTLSGNPLAMTAGYKTLQIVSQDGFYEGLEERSQALDQGVGENIKKLDVPVKHTRVGSMFCLFFTDGEVRDYDTAQKCDTEKFGAYFRQMLKRSIYLAPSQFEATFISAAHSREDIERTVKANYEALKAVFA